MKVLVIGSGGREHALTWKLACSGKVKKIFIAPGNPGTGELGENIPIEALDFSALVKFAREEGIDLTIVGPEEPLVKGIVDRFQEEGLRIFGPNQEAARLEGSKVYAKWFMKKYRIPTAEYEVFEDAEEAIEYIKGKELPLVIKAEGLAAGKGVIVARTLEEAVDGVNSILVDKVYGSAGIRIVVEEFLAGEEATILAFTDGKTIVHMLASQDHKQVYEKDQGPNTGGMGAYAPAPLVDEALMERVYREILLPTLRGLQGEGIDYRGVLYCGLMIKDGVPKVLEYNVRFGDPEAQVILPLLKTDLVEIAEAVIEGRLEKQQIEWHDKKALCVVMASGGYPGEYVAGKEISGLDKASSLPDIQVFQAGTKREGDRLLTAGGRVLAVTATGDTFKEVIEKAYEAVDQIYFPDFHVRRDIGWKIFKDQEV
ncbi:MAG: phosphoribosylamine--glycine ligase [Halanaerobiales bacterium]